MAKTNEKYRQELIAALSLAARDKYLLISFLQDLLTPAELRELAARWQIVKLLNEGVSQRDIGERLSVAVATVTRGSRMLLNPAGGFNRILKKQ